MWRFIGYLQVSNHGLLLRIYPKDFTLEMVNWSVFHTLHDYPIVFLGEGSRKGDLLRLPENRNRFYFPVEETRRRWTAASFRNPKSDVFQESYLFTVLYVVGGLLRAVTKRRGFRTSASECIRYISNIDWLVILYSFCCELEAQGSFKCFRSNVLYNKQNMEFETI